MERQYAVLGPLPSGVETRAFLGCEMADGQPQPAQPVVVVWLPEEVTKDAKQVERLQREHAFVTQLDHPNLIHVHGLECFEEGWARVVDYCDGEPLSRFLELARRDGGNIPLSIALRIILDVCEAVHHAHEQGRESMANRPLVHGALRPDTLMISFSGVVKVTGYGAGVLAGMKQIDHGPYAQHFMAPEQIIGGKSTVSPSSDVYALGAILYDLISGAPPFFGATDLENAILSETPQAKDPEGVLGELYTVIGRAMKKRGQDRFETVDELRRAVLEAMGGRSPASEEQVAAFANELVPPTSPEREQRAALIAFSDDVDAVTVLSRPTEAPEGVDPTLFAASRPATETGRIRVRSKSRTKSKARKKSGLSDVPAVTQEATTAIEVPEAPRQAPRREAETVVEQAPGRVAPDRESTQIERHETIRSQPPPPSIPVPPAAMAAQPAAPRPAGTPSQPVALPGAPSQLPVPSMVPHPSVPPGVRPSVPAGMMPPGASPYGVPPGMMGPPGARPSMPPGVMVPGMHPSMPPGMMPPGMRGSMPPGMRPSMPPGVVPQGMRGSVPVGMAPPGSMPPGHRSSVPAPPHGGASSAPPPERASVAPMRHVPLKGNYMDGTGELPAMKQSLPPPPAPDPFGQAGLKKDAPPRAMSEITNIEANLGDNSKIWLLVGIALFAVALALVMSIGKKPPEGLTEETSRKKLPKELVEAALKSGVPVDGETEPEPIPEPIPEPELVAPPGKVDPSVVEQPETPVVAEIKYGHLNIESNPNVDVFDGDKLLGRTPLRVRLKSGTYRLRFTDKDKMINRYKQYRVQPEGDHKDTVTFGESQLLVDAPDGARIFLNGRPIGKAPIEPYDIYEGRYLLKVTHEGKNWSEWFNATAGAKIEYRVRMND